MNPLNQNPKQHPCFWCGMIADEFYNDHWLCLDCIVEEKEDEEI